MACHFALPLNFRLSVRQRGRKVAPPSWPLGVRPARADPGARRPRDSRQDAGTTVPVLASRRDGFGEFDVGGGTGMLFGRIARLVIRFDGIRCGRQHWEVPPTKNFGGGYRDSSCDRHFNQSGCIRVESELDSRADFLRRLYLGCDPEAERLCQRYEINRVGLPVAAVTV